MSHAMTTHKITPTCPQWGIAELAAHFDITTRAIRFYEDKGLLSPARVGGHRMFSEADKVRLEKILRAKRIGFSLEDIKQFMDVTDGQVQQHDELLARKANFEAVIGRLRNKRRDIDVIAKDMQDMCALIDNYLETAPVGGLFEFADAYDAMFRAHLDEDFITV
ncbi:MAG TPA: MerR family DNA-binding transcriptional regulator [Hellea balneolensis]|uniref:MerR family DNA-binding transcriptional regulator n=1 Tax=Hellea balneolensis TaxID=287478 RepID=A0A7C3C9L5_9PROT|nr:MerR family DNA-binding transcriptional regulator [Hellea balneolensis]